TPKGVVVEHRSIIASNNIRASFYEEIEHPRFLLLSSVAFDSSVAGIFWTLLAGGTLVLPPDLSAHSITSAIAQYDVNCFLAVPSLYDTLIPSLRDLLQTELQEVIVAGESCSAELLRQHQEFF